METPHSVNGTDHQQWLRVGPKPNMDNRHTLKYHFNNFARAYRSWIVPFIKSRYYANQFRPVLCFLYTDLNCNLDCHYCYSQGRKIPGMSMEMAKDVVDWLDAHGCRVLAYMGGEPLVRKQFIIDLTRYASKKGFFVYLPTNGILMDAHFIDEIGKAGVSTINLAVDAVNGYNGLPKNLHRIKDQFEYLVEQEKRYGYITFFNINITKDNIEDVKALTEIARRYDIATDYHINEPPQVQYDNYKHESDGGWITEKEYDAIDELVDWLTGKISEGYTIVNSKEHLNAMKRFVRHELPPWRCEAGNFSFVIRLDGTFSPCFELYGDNEDWGSIYEGAKFDTVKLQHQKEKCTTHCLSTCNYQVQHYTQSMLHSFQWVAKHAYAHFFGDS